MHKARGGVWWHSVLRTMLKPLFHCWAAPSQTAQEGLFRGPVLKARNDAVKSEVVQMWAVGTVTLQMQTDDHRWLCRGVLLGYPPSAQAHFCFILALNLQFIHDGKPKIFTGAITTYQPMKGTSSVSLWHFCPWFGVLALFNTSDPSCVHQLWIPVCYEVYVVGIFVMIATLSVMFLKKEYCVAVAMVLKCLELDFTET